MTMTRSHSGAHVIKEMILPPDDAGELIHRLFDDGGRRIIVLVAGLAALEIDVRVLRGAADDRMLRVQGTCAVSGDQLVVDHGPQVLDRQLLDLVDFGARPEAVEKVHERNA